MKNVATITVNKLDLEFSVDPLFRKTSAAFDQGGARGLLLNHLATQGMSELKFDSSDSVDSVMQQAPTASAPIDMADLAGLAPFADADDDAATRSQICPPFAAFTFSGWDASTAAANDEEDASFEGSERSATPTTTVPMTVDTEYDEDAHDMDDEDDDVAFDQSFSEPPMGGDFDGDNDDMVTTSGEHQVRRSVRQELVLLQDNEFGWLNAGGKGWHGESDFSGEATPHFNYQRDPRAPAIPSVAGSRPAAQDSNALLPRRPPSTSYPSHETCPPGPPRPFPPTFLASNVMCLIPSVTSVARPPQSLLQPSRKTSGPPRRRRRPRRKSPSL